MYMQRLQGSSEKLFTSTAILQDCLKDSGAYSKPEFIGRVNKIYSYMTMAVLVEEGEEILAGVERTSRK